MNASPTKSNLKAKEKALALAQNGYDLMDRKHTALLRHIGDLGDRLSQKKAEAEGAFRMAYRALSEAELSLGDEAILEIAGGMPLREDFSPVYRTVMGIEVTEAHLSGDATAPAYGLYHTNALLDRAYYAMDRALRIAAEAAGMEESYRRLSDAAEKANKRKNALSSVVVPRLTEEIRRIRLSLEEKEREEFIRAKVAKDRRSR